MAVVKLGWISPIVDEISRHKINWGGVRLWLVGFSIPHPGIILTLFRGTVRTYPQLGPIIFFWVSSRVRGTFGVLMEQWGVKR